MIVASATSPSATGVCGSPGMTRASTSLTPSATTGVKIRLLTTFTPSTTKPAIGPSVRATITYSPPAIGQAEDSSAYT
jgi:hypothetical protein